MKRVYLLLVALCLWVSAVAQNENEYESKFMRFYVPDCTGSPLPTPIDTYIIISEQGEIFIKIHANFAYNASELSYFKKYAIPKGHNIYLKLDNEEIITLTCSLDKNIKDGFITTQNGVYQNYAGYSYFPIDNAVIEDLKAHNIIKVRGQFTSEVIDGSLQYTPESNIPETKDKFAQAEKVIWEKYNISKNKKSEQEILKQNPLHNF